ncbi:MAG: hypothetical protein QXL86_01485 [Candidatus Aenigmatarchaeota archaeon]
MSVFKDFIKIDRASLTGIEFYIPRFKKIDVRITYPHYGPTSVRDTLKSTEPHEVLIVIGACGSLTNEISVGDYILSTYVHTSYLKPKLGNREIVTPDENLLKIAEEVFNSKSIKYHKIPTGTAYAINDEDTDLENYTHKIYDKSNIKVIECESAEALYYGEKYEIPAMAMFYVSDNPEFKLTNKINVEMERKRKTICRKAIKELNMLGLEILKIF